MTPDIIFDIDPDIGGYMVYDISDMVTRYRVCTRYMYPISARSYVSCPDIGSPRKKTDIMIVTRTLSGMSRYRVTRVPDIGEKPDIGFGKVPDAPRPEGTRAGPQPRSEAPSPRTERPGPGPVIRRLGASQ